MEVIKIALLGLGTVGSGVYQTIESHQQVLQSILGKRVKVAAILIQDQHKEREIPSNILITTDFSEILGIPDLQLVIEATIGADPARNYILQSLAKGCHVITANKACIATYGHELFTYAKKYGRTLAIEATVAGGIPIIRTLRQLLQVNRVHKIEAILNGTTNYILTKMRKEQLTFAEALAEAQHAGYAEADPESDVKGIDAFYKIQILSRLVYGEQSELISTVLKGIEAIDLEDLRIAEALGLRLKLLARLEGNDRQHSISVVPTFVSEAHTLYTVEGVDNGIQIYSDVVGKLFLQGPGAGSFPTASAIVEDLVSLYQENQRVERNTGLYPIQQNEQRPTQGYWLSQVMHATPESIRDEIHRYYLPPTHHVVIEHSTTIQVGCIYITGLVMRCSEEDIKEIARIYPALYRWNPILDCSSGTLPIQTEVKDLV